VPSDHLSSQQHDCSSFLPQNVQTKSGIRPAQIQRVPIALYPEKTGRSMKLFTHLHLVPSGGQYGRSMTSFHISLCISLLSRRRKLLFCCRVLRLYLPLFVLVAFHNGCSVPLSCLSFLLMSHLERYFSLCFSLPLFLHSFLFINPSHSPLPH